LLGPLTFPARSHPSLGAWNAAGAAPLTWHDGDLWQAQLALPASGRVELKFVIRSASGALLWQTGENCVLELAPGAATSAAHLAPERRLHFTGSLGGRVLSVSVDDA